MFTSKSPELNINFLYQISAPLTSAFQPCVGFPPPPPLLCCPWCRAMVRILTLLTTLLVLQVVSRSGLTDRSGESLFDVCFFCYCFFVGVCSRLMNDDVHISYTICLYIIYILYIFYVCWNIYYYFFGECIAWRNGWQCDFLSRSLTLTTCALLDPTYIWVLDSSNETMCVGTFHHLIRISLYIY